MCLSSMVCSHCLTVRPIKRQIKIGLKNYAEVKILAQIQTPAQIPIGFCYNLFIPVSVLVSVSVSVSVSGSVNASLTVQRNVHFFTTL